MKTLKKFINYFSRTDLTLWSASVILIIVSFCVFDRTNYLSLAASITGATSLIFCAKGNPFGQLLMVFFSIMYAVISYTFRYYGEMITYLGMTAPMAVFSLVSWMRNPYNGNRAEVRVNRLKGGKIFFMVLLTAAVTTIFYFILKRYGTANLFPSTVSVATSFIAVFLTFQRSAYYALAYASNDIVLIILWTLAARADISYLSVIICFVMFLVNDIYGYISWSRMQKRQEQK